MISFPDVVTHNYDPTRGPFRNICNLPRQEAESILTEIRTSGKSNIKDNYLPRRLAIEDWLISESDKKLASKTLERPIYFFLGDFADGLDRSRPRSIVMPLAAFSADMLTFTYPDSMASLPLAIRAHHRPRRKAFHGQVFTLDEIRKVIASWGMPDKTDPSISYDRFIEVQVWNDTPLKRFHNGRASTRHQTASPGPDKRVRKRPDSRCT